MTEGKYPIPISLGDIYKEIRGLKEQNRKNRILFLQSAGFAVALLGASIWAATLEICWQQINAVGLMAIGITVFVGCSILLSLNRAQRFKVRSVVINFICFVIGAITAWILSLAL